MSGYGLFQGKNNHQLELDRQISGITRKFVENKKVALDSDEEAQLEATGGEREEERFSASKSKQGSPKP